MALQNFEQLNSMSTKWYDKMNIPQEEKKKRVDLSLMYAEIFDMWLTLIVTAVLSQQNASTWLEERLKVTAENYIGKEDIAYINDWSKKEAEKVTKVTFRNLNKSEDQETSEEEEEETEKRTIDFQELDISVPKDEYWTSEERGLLLGIECATITANYEDFLKGTEDGKTRKVWITEADDKVRDTHSEVHGEDIPINDYFLVGNSYMLFPGDISAGAEDKEIINCRCWCEYYESGKESGAVSGAYTNENDPSNTIRERVAKELYDEWLNRDRQYEIEAVAKNSGFSVEDIDRIFAHVFEREHLFADGTIHKFDPDYYMAMSWQRLREGKNIQEHDIILLQHELAEEKIMGKNLEIIYENVHNEVQEKYNYQVALIEYLKTHDA